MVVLFDLSTQPSIGALIIKVKSPSWNDKDRADHDHDDDYDYKVDYDHNIDFDHAFLSASSSS